MMKKPLYAVLAIGVLLSACSVSQNASKSYEDDIYYSSKDPKPPAEKKDAAALNNDDQASRDGKSLKQVDENGNTYITNNYYESDFDYDDYYDYEYASRIRRFHNPCYGLSYYDNYYTNSYWYSYNPYQYGLSIYLGYNWWGPSYYTYNYNPGFYWSQYPSYWHWNNPYAYWGGYNPYAWGYGSYWNGYNDGYWHGYHDGMWNNYYNGYYFNSYDNNSYYYGPRLTTTASNGLPPGQSSLGEKYLQAIAMENKNVPADKNIKGKDFGKDYSTGLGKTTSTGTAVNEPVEKPMKSIRNVGASSENDENGYSKPTSNDSYSKDGYERPAYYQNKSESTYEKTSSTNSSYEAPSDNNKPANNNTYTKPANSDQYEAPRNNSYSKPRNDNYSAPKKDNYSAPRSEPKNNNSAPRNNNNTGGQQKSSPSNAPRKH
jgi:hypothetical protein